MIETSDSFVGGAVYSDNITRIIYNVSSDQLPSTATLSTELFPLEDPSSLNFTYINGLDGYMTGPVPVLGSYYVSFTRALTKNNPDFENSNKTFVDNIIGYITMVSPATSLVNVTQNLHIEDSTRMAIIGLSNVTRAQAQSMDPSTLNASFILPSDICPTCYGDIRIRYDTPSYNALVSANWGTNLSVSVKGVGKVAVAYAPVRRISRVWGVLILQKHSVLYKPIVTLRVILLVCVFAIGFGVCLTTFILSGWVVKPITRLQAATEQSTNSTNQKRESSCFWPMFNMFRKKSIKKDTPLQPNVSRPLTSTGTEFRIPEKVVTRKYIKDELTELTETFNDMTTELRKQYNVLEEHVIQRTNEIKKAKVHAETANEAKSLFIANITHELRTPLNGILGMAAVSMEETDTKSIHYSLKVIFKSGELLLRLLTDLLSFSKTQVDNMQLEPKGFSISEITAQLHAIFDEQSKSAKVVFSIEVASPILERLELLGDINRILQVVMNLVSNSLKFTPTGGSVSVTISASLSSTDSEGYNGSIGLSDLDNACSNAEKLKVVELCITVQDTGPGIAPHLQSRVFEPFVQGDLALSEKRGGVGLGLSICSQLAKLMNGEISLKSELGKGSQFTFQLPLEVIQILDPNSVQLKDPIGPATMYQWDSKLANMSAYSKKDLETDNNLNDASETFVDLTVPPEPLKSSPADLSVLIAEDNRVNQEVLVKMLKLEGVAKIEVAKDGLEAVRSIKKRASTGHHFDIIFMDIQMPNLDGKQATEIIRKELQYEGIIIAVSAFTDSSNINDCLSVGMNHFLAKPLRRPQLHSLLMTCLQSQGTGGES